MGLFSFLTQEIAIDLGTANTIIIHNDKIVVDEPSIVLSDQDSRHPDGVLGSEGGESVVLASKAVHGFVVRRSLFNG